jgi:hypothetical protein
MLIDDAFRQRILGFASRHLRGFDLKSVEVPPCDAALSAEAYGGNYIEEFGILEGVRLFVVKRGRLVVALLAMFLTGWDIARFVGEAISPGAVPEAEAVARGFHDVVASGYEQLTDANNYRPDISEQRYTCDPVRDAEWRLASNFRFGSKGVIDASTASVHVSSLSSCAQQVSATSSTTTTTPPPNTVKVLSPPELPPELLL